jgi:antitoxin Phd
MPKTAVSRPKRKAGQLIAAPDSWKLEDAKARFSEVVRLAGTEGPQLVTVRGKEAAVVIAPETYRQMFPASKNQESLFDFLQGLGLSEFDTERDFDPGREVSL